MNKKEVSIILTGVTGRMLCKFSDFHKWAEERLGRPIFTHEFGTSFGSEEIQKQLTESVTEEEWKEIAEFFQRK